MVLYHGLPLTIGRLGEYNEEEVWPVDKSLAKTTNYSIPYLSNYSSELWFVEKEKGKCAILSLTTYFKTHLRPQTKWNTRKGIIFWHCFCALARSVVRFVSSASSRNHFLIGQNKASNWWFQKLYVGTKKNTTRKAMKNWAQKIGLFSWVQFCWRALHFKDNDNTSSICTM